MHGIPQHEIDEMVRLIQSLPEYFDPEAVLSAYRPSCREVISDPFSAAVATHVVRALEEEAPLSVVRIGDSEANILSFHDNPRTPHLDLKSVEKAVSLQQDSFRLRTPWPLLLRDLMMGAIMQADIIGVVGLWRAQPIPDLDEVVAAFRRDYRGWGGKWRAVDCMLRLAARGVFQNRILASVFLYGSVLRHLDDILLQARKLLIISANKRIVAKLRDKCPGLEVEFIRVGKPAHFRWCRPPRPHFLNDVSTALPADMKGWLGLVGAGPWAELYCTWIKQRGGVAVDIGSGFDLLDGAVTRPIHGKLGLENQTYKL